MIKRNREDIEDTVDALTSQIEVLAALVHVFKNDIEILNSKVDNLEQQIIDLQKYPTLKGLSDL